MFKNRKGFVDAVLEDAFKWGLENSGFSVEVVDVDYLSENLDKYTIEDYDIIAFDVQQNSLFCSNKRRLYLYTELFNRAKDGALTMYACDVMIKLQPHLWDKPVPGYSVYEKRTNIFNTRPIRVIISLDPSIEKNKEHMDKAKKVWFSNSNLHKDSTLHFIEWVSFAINTYNPEGNVEYEASLFTPKIRNFYYGMKRDKLVDSLINNGIKTKEDLVFGSIGNHPKLSEVQKVIIPSKKPLQWLPYANIAERVVFPYEPIKSEYQITLRLLEVLKFYKDKVVFDDRVNKRLVEFAKSDKIWHETAAESIEKIKTLYEV